MDNTILFDKITEQEKEIMKLRAENNALWRRISELTYEVMETRHEARMTALDANCTQRLNVHLRDKIKKIEEDRRIERAAAYAEIERILKK
nr:MAG TPA: hypothetical protein [Caudoviricetes sp.]